MVKESHGVSRSLKESHRVSRRLRASQGVSRASLKVSTSLMESHRVSKSLRESQKVSRSLTESHGVSRTLKKSHGVSRSLKCSGKRRVARVCRPPPPWPAGTNGTAASLGRLEGDKGGCVVMAHVRRARQTLLLLQTRAVAPAHAQARSEPARKPALRARALAAPPRLRP